MVTTVQNLTVPRSTSVKVKWQSGQPEAYVYQHLPRPVLYSLRDSVRTPNYRKLKLAPPPPSGLKLPMNPYEFRVRQSANASHRVRYTLDHWYNSPEITQEGGLFDVPQLTLDMQDPILRVELWNAATGRLATRMDGSKFELGVFLCEARKTGHGLVSAATEIKRLLENLRGFGKRLATKRELTDFWMDYRYGMGQIVNDMVDSLKYVYDQTSRGAPARVTAFAEKLRVIQTPNYANAEYLGDPNRKLVGTLDREATLYYKTRFTIWYGDDFPAIGSMRALGLTNPFALGYELLRLSWVLDWFWNIGEYLKSIDRFLGQSFRGGTVSFVRTAHFKWSMRNLRCADPSNFPRFRILEQQGFNSPIEQLVSQYKREPLSGFPSNRIPRLDCNIDWRRGLDAISLARQAIPGKKEFYIPNPLNKRMKPYRLSDLELRNDGP